MNSLFLLLRIVTGVSVLAALAILFVLVFLKSALTFAKESAGVVAYVAVLFGSGFQKSLPVKAATGIDITRLQIGLLILFIAMIVSVFLPGAKVLLHVIALIAVGTCLWLVWAFNTSSRIDVVYVPFMTVWLIYYACSLYQAKLLP